MQHSVCIALNERETEKEQIADELEKALGAFGIHSVRVEITSDVEERLRELKPSVIVLDYLLGDYSTGLDVLSKLSELDESQRPTAFFLTDEPSVRVAVEAMRLGAKNYMEIENPQAIPTLADEILSAIRERSSVNPYKADPIPKLSGLVANSPSTRELHSQAAAFAQQNVPVIVILGQPGIGKRTLAKAIHHERKKHGVLKMVDLSLFDESFDCFFFKGGTNATQPVLGSTLALIVSQAEEDTSGELIELLEPRLNLLWPESNRSENQSSLTICTSSETTARMWERMCSARILTIPALDSHRQEDITALVQRFTREAAQVSGEKLSAPPAKTMKAIAEWDWPQGISQLKAVVTGALLMSQSGESELDECLTVQRTLWENEHMSVTEPPSPLLAAMTVEECGHNLRIAAAKLGCNSRLLRDLLAS